MIGQSSYCPEVVISVEKKEFQWKIDVNLKTREENKKEIKL